MKSKLTVVGVYLLAAFTMAGSVILRLLLVPVIGINTAYLTVFPTIALIAVIAGTGPALLASIIGIVLSESWAFGPVKEYFTSSQIVRGSAAVITGIAVGYLSSKLKDARQKAELEAQAYRESEVELRKITNELRQQKRDLQIAKNAAEAANNEKLKFLATMSHELRTPLTSILGFSELLGEENMPIEEKTDLLSRIKRNGDLLTRLIDEILDLSKIESGKIELELMEVNLLELLNDVTGVLSLQAQKKGIELKLQVDGVVPEKIITDPTRLRQILSNIIGNAIKFTSKGWVKVSLKVAPERNEVQFFIEDTGEGIEVENIEKIFEPFVQADSSHTRRYGGTGLGLVLSRKIARTLGGDVVLLKSTPQRGSVFQISIALKVKASARSLSRNSEFSQDLAVTHIHDAKVLVTDDSADNLLLVSKLLSSEGVQVEVASSGEEALKKIEGTAADFNLILMDIQMPGMDGYEVTRKLREKGWKRPIIALTAYAMRDDFEKSLASGFDDHLVKPIRKNELVAVIAKHLHSDSLAELPNAKSI
ncbi:MAG: ATP-binding protein [Pseudobdellovibrionaceae bacterium]